MIYVVLTHAWYESFISVGYDLIKGPVKSSPANGTLHSTQLVSKVQMNSKVVFGQRNTDKKHDIKPCVCRFAYVAVIW